MKPIYPSATNFAPRQVGQIDYGNHLAKGCVYLSVLNSITPYDGISKSFGVPGGTVVNGVGPNGSAASFLGGSHNNCIQIASSTDAIIPTARVTIAAIRQKKDTTARASTLFGQNSTADNRCLATVPYSDGNIYWDFGSANTGRLTVSGQTWDTRLDKFIFIAGPTKGREVWRNGQRIGSNAAVTTTRPSSTVPFTIGAAYGDISLGDDNEYVYYFGIFDAEWTDSQCASWFNNPYQLFKHPKINYCVDALGTVLALIGQSATASQGGLAPNSALPLSGQALTSAGGTLSTSAVYALIGREIASAYGSLSGNSALALLGAAATLSGGTVISSLGDIVRLLSGLSASFGQGSLSGTVEAPLTGSSASSTIGSFTVSASTGLTGSTITAGNGGISALLAYALPSQALSSAKGAITPQLVMALVGAEGTLSGGTVTSFVGTQIVLDGLSMASASGSIGSSITITPTGRAATAAGGLPVAAIDMSVSGHSAQAASGTTTQTVSLGLSGRTATLRFNSVILQGISDSVQWIIFEPASKLIVATSSSHTLNVQQGSNQLFYQNNDEDVLVKH